MAQEVCLAGQVEDITILLKTYRVPTNVPVLMLLERQPQQIIEPHKRQDLLHFARFEHAFDFAVYTSGRVFHQDGELRWEKQAGAIQIVYTGHAQYRPEIEITASMVLDHCQPTSRSYFLFGKRLDSIQLRRIGMPPAQEGDFAEVRIPRLLRYPPLPGAERAQIVVRAYRDPETGTDIAFRFTELVGAK